MKYLIIPLLILVYIASMAQNKEHSNSKFGNKKKAINTQTFSLDLGVPDENSIKSSSPVRNLEVKHNQPVAFRLLNANPFRYIYYINSTPVSLFTDKEYNIDNIFKESEGAIKEKVTSSMDKKDTLNKFLTDDSFKKNETLKYTEFLSLPENKSLLIDPGVKIEKTSQPENRSTLINNSLEVIKIKSQVLQNDLNEFLENCANEEYLPYSTFLKGKNDLKKRVNNLLNEYNNVIPDTAPKDSLTYQSIIRDINASLKQTKETLKKLSA